MIGKLAKRMIRAGLGSVGLELVRRRAPLEVLDASMEDEYLQLVARCAGFHDHSSARLYALYQAIRYLVQHRVPGALVECGVFEGRNPVFMAHTLNAMGVTDRDIYLYDTFEGMTPATDQDRWFDGTPAEEVMRARGLASYGEWCRADLETVRRNVYATGYPEARFRFVVGPVEKTIPTTRPDRIALLRLDTDWYASTYHELVHLYPCLSVGGVLILDDYGAWRGAKEATDAYFRETRHPILLNRIDRTGRIAVKTEAPPTEPTGAGTDGR